MALQERELLAQGLFPLLADLLACPTQRLLPVLTESLSLVARVVAGLRTRYFSRLYSLEPARDLGGALPVRGACFREIDTCASGSFLECLSNFVIWLSTAHLIFENDHLFDRSSHSINIREPKLRLHLDTITYLLRSWNCLTVLMSVPIIMLLRTWR